LVFSSYEFLEDTISIARPTHTQTH